MKTVKRLIALSFALIFGFTASGHLIRARREPLSSATNENEFVPIPMGAISVNWELYMRGYGGYAHIVVQGRYDVGQRQSKGTRDYWGFCEELFSLTYKRGGIVKAEGTNSVGDQAEFSYATPLIAGSLAGTVCKRSRGGFEIILAGPNIKALNAAAEEALGCWGEDWPAMRMSPSAFCELASKTKTIEWEGSAMSTEQREAAPGCQEGLAKIKLSGKLPAQVTAGICKECGGIVTSPAKGKSLKKCKGGIFDEFQIIE